MPTDTTIVTAPNTSEQDIAKKIRIINKRDETAEPNQLKLNVTLEVLLSDETTASDAAYILESQTARRIAIAHGEQVFKRECGYSDQSSIVLIDADGEVTRLRRDSAKASRITYTVLRRP